MLVNQDRDVSLESGHARMQKILSIEWLGQTIASLCWIVSVFTYGLTVTGDWLQLIAASAWLLANLAAVVTARSD